ncbi:MAG: hypothetical protein IPJ88_05185 [Myxococcales bacterium]|nr:MAG: hypothetical protein IPJ88_05185 [Myxococcales bacterium]
MKKRHTVIWFGYLIAFVLSASVHAGAQDKANNKSAKASPGVPGELLVIAASEKEGKIDPALSKEPALKHRSFQFYKSMKLLSRPKFQCVAGKAVEQDLPNGRRIRLLLDKTLEDGRYQVQFSINKPNKKDYLRSVQVILAPGVPVFQAGQRMRDDDLILGIRLGERKAKKAETSKK